MEFAALREHECALIQMLLNGISDDNENVRSSCMTFLEEHGQRMQEALRALGEDEEMQSPSQ